MKHQKGQSLIFLLGFTAALVGSMLLVFNTGQVTADKERLVNAADAAAYSGAIWEARALNFQSYMNRAIVANEVAIAQSVSLRSWTDYVRSSLNNINLVTRFIPYLGAVTNAMAQASTSMNNAAQTILIPAEAGHQLRQHRALGRRNGGALPGRAGRALDRARNAARQRPGQPAPPARPLAFIVRNANAWRNFTRDYSGNDRARLKDVVMRSRDGFTARRGFELDAVRHRVPEARRNGAVRLRHLARRRHDVAAHAGLPLRLRRGDADRLRRRAERSRRARSAATTAAPSARIPAALASRAPRDPPRERLSRPADDARHHQPAARRTTGAWTSSSKSNAPETRWIRRIARSASTARGSPAAARLRSARRCRTISCSRSALPRSTSCGPSAARTDAANFRVSTTRTGRCGSHPSSRADRVDCRAHQGIDRPLCRRHRIASAARPWSR